MRLMRLVLKDGERESGWVKAKNISDATLREIEQANLRELYENELILDCENKLKAFQVRKRLDKEGWSYKEWDTSSRGRHFHILIQGLDKITDKERLLYRSRVIADFGTDPSKKNGFIAMEHRPHLKTGKYKTLVKDVKGINKLDLDLLSSIKLEIAKTQISRQPSNLDRTDIVSLKRNTGVKSILSSYGVDTSKYRMECPLGHPSNSKKNVAVFDNDTAWYCFNCGNGGDIFKLVEMKRNCTFAEALERIRDGGY